MRVGSDLDWSYGPWSHGQEDAFTDTGSLFTDGYADLFLHCLSDIPHYCLFQTTSKSHISLFHIFSKHLFAIIPVHLLICIQYYTFALLNFLKFKVKVKVFYMPETLSNIVLMTKAYNVTLFNGPIHQLFRFCWVIFAVDRFKFLKNNYININSAKLGTSQFSGANFLNS